MAQFPSPGGSKDTWGEELQEALLVSHNNDGTHNQEDWTPSVYAGEESITFPNGLVIKHGTKTSTAVIDTVEFAADFDTACVNVQITQLSLTTLSYNLRAYSYTVGGFLWNSVVKGYRCSWLAIGY